METLSRREMVQKLLSGVAVGAGLPLVASSHPIYRLLKDGETFDRLEERRGEADWKPLFLKPEQDGTLVALSEVMIPGATSAKVNHFIDLLLSVDTAEHQRDFVGSLATVEDEAKKRFGRGYAALTQGERETLLADFSKMGAHDEEFQNLKVWIAGAYYSSEQGMRELGWNGNYAFASYPGCEHEEH